MQCVIVLRDTLIGENGAGGIRHGCSFWVRGAGAVRVGRVARLRARHRDSMESGLPDGNFNIIEAYRVC